MYFPTFDTNIKYVALFVVLAQVFSTIFNSGWGNKPGSPIFQSSRVWYIWYAFFAWQFLYVYFRSAVERNVISLGYPYVLN